jgi:curved DNA-binding protein CbpA
LKTETIEFRMKDYYQILEVEPDASQEKIREQYLLLIQAWHPDKFPHPAQKLKAEERTKAINAAYEVLRSSDKRAEYDRRAHPSKTRQERAYRQPEPAQAVPAEEEPLRKEPADGNSPKGARTSVKVFINGHERLMRVEDLVKASVEYFDQETKEDLGSDYFRTHAAVRAAASRCIKHGVEIHIRKLAA